MNQIGEANPVYAPIPHVKTDVKTTTQPLTLDDPEDAVTAWQITVEKLDIYDPKKEHLALFMLDIRNHFIAWNLVSIGDLSIGIASPREIFRPAITAAAKSIILAHNHPSGDPEPSQPDRDTTNRIADGGDLLGIRLLDHVIIGGGAYYSFQEHGMMK